MKLIARLLPLQDMLMQSMVHGSSFGQWVSNSQYSKYIAGLSASIETKLMLGDISNEQRFSPEFYSQPPLGLELKQAISVMDTHPNYLITFLRTHKEIALIFISHIQELEIMNRSFQKHLEEKKLNAALTDLQQAKIPEQTVIVPAMLIKNLETVLNEYRIQVSGEMIFSRQLDNVSCFHGPGKLFYHALTQIKETEGDVGKIFDVLKELLNGILIERKNWDDEFDQAAKHFLNLHREVKKLKMITLGKEILKKEAIPF